jgi:hypothetical protein
MGLCIFIYVPYVRRVYLCIDANRIRFEGFATATRDGTSRRDARRRTTRRETRAHVYLPPLDATAAPKLDATATYTPSDDDDDDDDAGARDGDAGDARRATRDVDSRRAMRATDAHSDASTLNASSARRDRVQRDEDGALVQPHEQEGFVGVRRARERATDEARSDPVPSRDDAEGGRDGERRE